jgi:hypothetical protein
MANNKLTLWLSDDYVRAHRDELQRQYDLRERIRAVERCIDNRWPSGRGTRGDFEPVVRLEQIGDDWAILRFASVRGVRRVRFRLEVVAGRALLDRAEDL